MVDERAEEEVADGDEEDEEEEQLETDDPLHSGDVDACSSNTQHSVYSARRRYTQDGSTR